MITVHLRSYTAITFVQLLQVKKPIKNLRKKSLYTSSLFSPLYYNKQINSLGKYKIFILINVFNV